MITLRCNWHSTRLICLRLGYLNQLSLVFKTCNVSVWKLSWILSLIMEHIYIYIERERERERDSICYKTTLLPSYQVV